MKDDLYTLKSGALDVGDGHQIYYQQWGNADAKPIFYLHGGPGSSTKDKHKLIFDPEIHQVIFHDQRGCGLSLPTGSLENNTTPDLVNDIEKLRLHFGLEEIMIMGGSWGSCLALAYAEEYPKNVSKMLLRGIFTGRRSELDYIAQGGLATHYPDIWQQYIEVVPKQRRNDTTNYYFEMMSSKDTKIADDHIRRWNTLEASAMSIFDDPQIASLNEAEVSIEAKAMALIEAHYFVNNCFLADSQLLNKAGKLSSIPIVIVQGRHDHVCPPETAYELAAALGKNCHLHFTTGGHAHEAGLRDALKAYAWSFLR